VSEMRAVGYGESRPIADNETEAGRDANRRIEFTLIGAAPAAALAATADSAAEAPAADGTTIAALAAPTDGAGCVANITALLAKDKITFDPGSDAISDVSIPLIEALSALLQQCPGVPIEVAGHTDSQGTERNNLTLSENRAKAVLVALLGTGVDVSTLKAVGYGETKPIADNGTEDGREANRRIEFTLIGTPAPASETAPAATAATATPAAAPATGTPDFSNDTSPSIAPQEKTLRPTARPANNG